MKKALFLLCFTYFAEAVGQDSIIKPIMVSGGSSYQADPLSTASPDLVWNKWDTKNFIILSIDKSQGLYLKKSIEDIKNSFQRRWGFEAADFLTPCKVLCVPEVKYLSRFFSIESPRSETRKDSEGILSSAIWFNADDKNHIDYLVASVCLDSSSNSMIIKRGVSKLEKSVDSLKTSFSSFSEINIKNTLEVDEKKWLTLSTDDKEKFDNSAALVCLLLRREFGIDKFSSFVKSKQDLSSILALYGFEDLESFSKTLNRYAKNLSEDISSGKTPNKYLIFK